MTIIKDCIYGFIDIPPILVQFIDSPEIQRLRDIRQLGFVQYVYPSATHSRFEHSLGVVHLAGVVIDELRLHGSLINDREKILVQLAGLFHDAGHVAFSHLIDYILVEEGCQDTHEIRSIQLLERANNRLNVFTLEEIKIVTRMILGIESEANPFLYQIIHNRECGLDVDRLDYLQRDSYHTGVPGFRADYLIKCMRVSDNRLCFLQKAFEDVKHTYDTRRKMFTLVYRHKTVLKIEEIIRDIIKRLGLITSWKSVDWVALDDIQLTQMIRTDPEYAKLVRRDWDKSEIDLYQHCLHISQPEIEEQLKMVRFVNTG